jgi:elongator complex protein 3
MSFYSEITDLILSSKIHTKEELHKTKIKLCKKYKIDTIPSDSEILSSLPDSFSELQKEIAINILRKKPMRTISGVAIIAVMTSPEKCPHGRCIPCPGGPDSNTPQSYTGYEPATMRALINNFDPYMQTKSRLEQLVSIGHSIDKIDLIIMGGTFTSRIPDYQNWFVKRCFDALNKDEATTLDSAKIKNESAQSRCIGLTIETRPDWFRLQHADKVLELGATRVELGIQTVFDDVLFGIKRGHTVLDSISATRIAKDCGFKVCYHMMPGLPGSNNDRDIESFQTIFDNAEFKPDMIKIYPTLTIKGTILYESWRKGVYEPLSNKDAIKLIANLKDYIPEWIRIQRIQRDIPAQLIDAGVTKSNLRQLVENEMMKHKKNCRCIRCREIGHNLLKEKIEIDENDIEIDIIHYDASGGEEIFISLVEKKHDLLIGYLRLRDVFLPHRYELKRNPCMIIRELKILGREIPIGLKNKGEWQHRGFGKELLDEAELLCREEFDKKYIFVLSGIGVKEYYRKHGYKDIGLYNCKKLK